MKDAGRHEYKYLVDEQTIALLESRMRLLMQKDPHVCEGGYYQIRSVYFDDPDDTCYRKNEAGVDPRVKYRMRIYGVSASRIMLEKKVKQNGMTRKYAAPLTKEQAGLLLGGGSLSTRIEEFDAYPPLLRQFALLQKTNGLRAKVIVLYDRIPYVEPRGNVRVTFDKHIAASTDFSHFFAPEILRHPIQAPGQHLMEVKYDAFLPRAIREALGTGRHRQETFSKFYSCRRYMKEAEGV